MHIAPIESPSYIENNNERANVITNNNKIILYYHLIIMKNLTKILHNLFSRNKIEGNLMQHDHDFHQLCQKEKAQVASFTKLQCMHDMAFFVYNINVLKN